MPNWEATAKEYQEENEYDDEQIHEWVDGMVPIYYVDIRNSFESFSDTITEDDVGSTISEIMQRAIYHNYYDLFTTALTDYRETLETMEGWNK